MFKGSRSTILMVALALLMLLAACGTGGNGASPAPETDSGATGSPSPIAETATGETGSPSPAPETAAGETGGNGASPTISIGSKGFTEQLILGEMMAVLLENADYTVERNLNLNTSAIAHQALINGDIDMYPEYTGTALTSILNLPVASDPDQVYSTVKQAYEEQFDATWLESIGFNSTYAMVMSRKRAEELGITTLSDLEGQADQLVLGTGAEFLGRPDGLPGLKETYNIEFADERVMDLGLMYDAVAQGQVDIVAGISTDGRIPALDLVVLKDDQRFFPPYIAVPVVRQDLLEEAPDVRDILNQLAGRIDETTMAELNYQVDQEGHEPMDVARQFLTEQGLIE